MLQSVCNMSISCNTWSLDLAVVLTGSNVAAPFLQCRLSSMLRIFAYLDAARHVGDVSYSDYLPFNTGDTTR